MEPICLFWETLGQFRKLIILYRLLQLIYYALFPAQCNNCNKCSKMRFSIIKTIHLSRNEMSFRYRNNIVCVWFCVPDIFVVWSKWLIVTEWARGWVTLMTRSWYHGWFIQCDVVTASMIFQLKSDSVVLFQAELVCEICLIYIFLTEGIINSHRCKIR